MWAACAARRPSRRARREVGWADRRRSPPSASGGARRGAVWSDPRIGGRCSRSPRSPLRAAALAELARMGEARSRSASSPAPRHPGAVPRAALRRAAPRRRAALPARRQGRLLVRPRARRTITVLEIVELLDGPLGGGAEGIFADAAAAARDRARDHDDRRRGRAREPRRRRGDVLHLSPLHSVSGRRMVVVPVSHRLARILAVVREGSCRRTSAALPRRSGAPKIRSAVSATTETAERRAAAMRAESHSRHSGGYRQHWRGAGGRPGVSPS